MNNKTLEGPLAQWAGTLGLLATALIAGSAWAEDMKPVAGGDVAIALTTDIQGINPGVTRDGNTDAVINHVAEGLVAYKEDGSVGLLGAKALAVSDDGLSYSFTLRDGMTFHNGAPVTSAEVKWSWDRLLDEKTGWRCRSWFVPGGDVAIRSIETPDARTIVFKLVEPTAIFLPKMANHQCIGPILHPDSVGADGKFVTPIATGPYKLAEWKRGEYVTLQRFDGYVANTEPKSGFAGNRTPYIDRLKFIVVPDAAVAKAALLAGDVQLSREFTPNDVAELEATDGLKVYSSDSFNWKLLLFNRKDGLFANVKLRQAIAEAIDIDEVAQIMSNGLAKGNPSAIPLLSNFHNSVQDERPAFDPAKAKAHAQAAGYKGETLKIMTNRRFQDDYDTALIVQEQLKRAGFKVELEVVEWATQDNAYYAGGYQMMVYSYSPRTEPYLSFELVSDTKRETAKAHEIVSDAFTALLRQAATTLDPARRQAAFDAMHRILITDLPGASLYNPAVVSASSDKLMGYSEFGVGHPRLWGAWLANRPVTPK
ncbi:ABC transporter substrate-binding protein [Chelatococcus asaccharovorans]|uniref:ABC transporter substrate-binding protein n=1 Tax=Chelatococcus asaccharovorans TaxID=28210 RepID=UPI00224C788B|nr:ABC transporter substrate-binding protein [Chelatococcus asaccharovorans]CAH1658199.1 Oligopeptide-binding protein AppA [Chelatococcus asaccharovorans]CAH1688795.1 Oligopeptide-binding protein AppA [Chelatococcus asaccharovorans]